MKLVPTDEPVETVVAFNVGDHETVVACWEWEGRLVVEVRDPAIATILIYNGHGAYVPWPREVWERLTKGEH